MKHILFLMAVVSVITGCGEKKQATESPVNEGSQADISITDVQIKNAGIVTGKMQQKTISAVLRLNGKVDVPPQNMVSVSVPMGGYLKTTRLLPGMHVSKGDIIGVIEDQQYIQLQQDYLTAKAKIGFLENEYLRQKELNISKASSDKAYQQAEADFRSQQVLITSLAEKLSLAGINIHKINESSILRSINIYSPINGYVSKVNVNIGKYVAPTDVLFELIDPRDIHLALKVFEKDLNKLFIGQRLTAYTNNEPSIKYQCEVLLISRDLTPERSADVHCHFDKYDKALVPGTYMNADIEIKNKLALVLPEEAVVQFGNRQFIFVMTAPNHFRMTEVNTGETENGYIEIVSGEKLAAQDIAIKGAYSLLMSLKNKSEK